jgi:O-antigen/teichoic acid export membrane protein
MSKDRLFTSYSWQIAKAIFAFLSVIVYSRFLGATARGTLSIYLLYVQLFLLFNEMFVGSALANWFAIYGFRRFTKRIVWISVIMLLFGVLLAVIVGWPGTYHAGLTLLLLSLWVSVLVFQNVAMNYFQSRSEITRKAQYLFSFELLKWLLLSLLWWVYVPLDSNILKVLLLLVSAGVIWSIWVAKELWQLGAFQEIKSQAPIQHTWAEGIWAQGGQIALFLVYRTPLFATSYFLGDSAAGVLANTFLMVDTIWIFTNTIGSMVHGRTLNLNSELAQERFCARAEVWSFWGTMAILLVVLALPEALYTWVFGHDFSAMPLWLNYMVPGILALSLFASRGNLYHARNEFKRLLLHHGLAWIFMILAILWMHLYQESVTITPLIFLWNLALCSIAVLHYFHRKFRSSFPTYFWVNTLLIWRLTKIVYRRMHRA